MAGLEDPLYRQSAASVELLSAEPADRELEARLPDETRAIIGALREADRLSTGEVTEILGGVGRPTAPEGCASWSRPDWRSGSASRPRIHAPTGRCRLHERLLERCSNDSC